MSKMDFHLERLARRFPAVVTGPSVWTEMLDGCWIARLLYSPFFRPCYLSFAALINQSATKGWQLNSGMNLAAHLSAADSPSNLDGSSAGLLLLGTLSIHQKEGKWASKEKKALIRSSMVGLPDRPLTIPPLAEFLESSKTKNFWSTKTNWFYQFSRRKTDSWICSCVHLSNG